MTERKHPKLIYIALREDKPDGTVYVGQAGLTEETMVNLPPGDPDLVALAEKKARTDLGRNQRWKIIHAETAVALAGREIKLFTVTDVRHTIEASGLQPAGTLNGLYHCSAQTAANAIRAVKESRRRLSESEIIPWPKEEASPAGPGKKHRKAQRGKAKKGHAAADALDWETATRLIEQLKDDCRYRDAMLVGVGIYMGLRISDSLTLRWSDIAGKTQVEMTEQKTGKRRTIRINPALTRLAAECYEELCIEDPQEYIAKGTQNGGKTHLTRQRVNQIISGMKQRYLPGRNLTFSSHTFRKTFGRRVYENECAKGRGDTALMLLADVFGHSNTNITKRYLGIRKDEILSVYDVL